MKRNKNKKGFTIVELVIVIGVIGILSAILIPTFVSLTSKANDAALKSNLANAYSMYAADAADGKVDDTTTDLPFLSQANVFLSTTKTGDSIKGYTYSASEGWSVQEVSKPTAYSLIVDKTYNTYYVFGQAN